MPSSTQLTILPPSSGRTILITRHRRCSVAAQPQAVTARSVTPTLVRVELPSREAGVWLYETDEDPKRKHHWQNDYAGFVVIGQNYVGKCPSSMTLAAAQDKLNQGIPWSPRNWRREHPQRIYVVDSGVLFRATPTNPGRSYHGFPEHYSRFPNASQQLRRDVLALARTLDCEDKLREWMRW